MLLERVSAGGESITVPRSAMSTTAAIPYVAAAAAAGLVEVAVDRVLAPVVAHLPAFAGVSAAGHRIDRAGDAASGAAALLVAAAVVAVLLTRRGPMLGMLGLAAATTGYAVVTGSGDAAAASRVALVATAVAAALVVVGRAGGWRRATVTAAAGAVGFGMWPLLAADLGVAGGPGRRLAEIAFVATPILAFAAIRRNPGWSRVGAVVAVLGALTMLVVRPADGAMMSMWALGATMAMPTVVYLLASGAAGAVVGRAVADRRARLAAAALILLAVAGIQAPALHHNLTAALSLALFCRWAVMSTDHEEEACRDCPVASS